MRSPKCRCSIKSHARQILAAVVLLVGAYMVISGLARLG
jgi:MFS superfamily sulfate permease-like transporter